MNYEKQFQQLANTQKGSLQKHGETLIQYIQDAEQNYATSKEIASNIEGDRRPHEIGTALGALEKIYGKNFDYTSGKSTRGQWMLHRLNEAPLQELSNQVLEQ